MARGAPDGWSVACDQELAALRLVRPEADEAADARAVVGDQAAPLGRLEPERRERHLGGTSLHRDADEEQAHERTERGSPLSPAEQCRHFATGKQAEKVLAEQRPHSTRGEVSSLERGSQQRRAVRGVSKEQGQASILAEFPAPPRRPTDSGERIGSRQR